VQLRRADAFAMRDRAASNVYGARRTALLTLSGIAGRSMITPLTSDLPVPPLPPLGIVFGLFVGFTAAQVWSDSASASVAVDREASALRTVALLAVAFPGEPKNRLDALNKELHCRSQSAGMAVDGPSRDHTYKGAPRSFRSPAIYLSLQPVGEGQQIAQREIISAQWTLAASV
jgi:hypothetical protein